MYEMKIAAGARSERAAATLGVHTDKGTQKTLAFHQQRVYDLLQSCKKYSAADISVALRLSDPRSCIRDLRAKGIDILDEWVPSEHGSRFKRYYLITPSGQSNIDWERVGELSQAAERYETAILSTRSDIAGCVSAAVLAVIGRETPPVLTGEIKRIFEEYGRPFAKLVREALDSGNSRDNAGKEVRHE